jgi:hypothetical protein
LIFAYGHKNQRASHSFFAYFCFVMEMFSLNIFKEDHKKHRRLSTLFYWFSLSLSLGLAEHWKGVHVRGVFEEERRFLINGAFRRKRPIAIIRCIKHVDTLLWNNEFNLNPFHRLLSNPFLLSTMKGSCEDDIVDKIVEGSILGKLKTFFYHLWSWLKHFNLNISSCRVKRLHQKV